MRPSGTASGQTLTPLLRVLEVAVWTLVGFWAVSSLWFPFGWDQGIMAWVGDVIVGGGMPYRDAFDIKGPLAHYIFALAELLFGRNLWGIRVLDLLGLAACGWLISDVTRRHTDRRSGPWAAALFVLWFASLTFWHTAQPDGFAAMILGIGFLPLLRSGEPRLSLSAAAGVAVGLATAIKPHYAAFLAVPAVFHWAVAPRRLRSQLAHAGAAAAGAVATVGAILGWFAIRGALDELIEVHILYNAQAYSSGSALALGERLRGIFTYVLSGELFVVLLPAALLGLVRLHRSDRVAFWTLSAWAGIAFAGVVLQNKFFDYQWIPMFPPVAILAVVGLHGSLTGGSAGLGSAASRPGLGHMLFLVILVHASIQPAFEVVNWVTHVTGIRDKAAYYDTFGVPGPDHRMAEYIREHSEPEDHLIVMGWNIELLHMTGRPTMSRLAYSLPVWMGEGTGLRERYRDELMDDLLATPPELIVVAPQAEPLLGREVAMDEFPAFERLLADRYEAEVTFGDLLLYRLIQ